MVFPILWSYGFKILEYIEIYRGCNRQLKTMGGYILTLDKSGRGIIRLFTFQQALFLWEKRDSMVQVVMVTAPKRKIRNGFCSNVVVMYRNF